MSGTGYKRVYRHHGAYWFVDTANKWHRLSPIADGEPAMLRALAKLKNGPEARPGSVPALVKTFRAERLPAYAEVTRYDYGLMLDKIEAAMRDIDVSEATAMSWTCAISGVTNHAPRTSITPCSLCSWAWQSNYDCARQTHAAM
jgi:hypothetical protein